MTNLLLDEPPTFWMFVAGVAFLALGSVIKQVLLPPPELRDKTMTYVNNPDFTFKSAGEGKMLMLALSPEAKLFIEQNFTFDATTKQPMSYHRAVLFIDQIRNAGLSYNVLRLPYIAGVQP